MFSSCHRQWLRPGGDEWGIAGGVGVWHLARGVCATACLAWPPPVADWSACRHACRGTVGDSLHPHGTRRVAGVQRVVSCWLRPPAHAARCNTGTKPGSVLLCEMHATRAACAPTARLLDTDSYLYSDPYKYLTVPPLSEVQFMSLQDGGLTVNGAWPERASLVDLCVMPRAAFLSAALLRGCSTRDLESHGERLTEFPCRRRRLLHSQRQAGGPCRLGDCIRGAWCAAWPCCRSVCRLSSCCCAVLPFPAVWASPSAARSVTASYA